MDNFHCNVVSIGSTGLLIRGNSGDGKTSLTLGLLDRAARLGIPASLISDDQAFLETRDNALFARVPEQIAGKIEIRGYGIVKHAFVPECRIDLVSDLVEIGEVERIPEAASTRLLGVALPLIKVPRQHEEGAIRIIFAALDEHFAVSGSR